MAFASSRVGAQEAIIKPCDLCEDDENVNWFCKDCAKNLCERCTKGHLKIATCKNHHVVSILEGAAISKENCPVLCPYHDLPFSFFCRTCDVIACVKCLTDVHSTHGFIDIHEFQSELHDRLNETLEKKETERKEICRNIDEFVKYTNTCGKALTKNCADIDDQTQAVKIALDNEGQKLKNNLKTETKGRLTEANECKQKLEAINQEYDTGIQDVRRKLRLQTASTLRQFVKESTSNLQSLSPVSIQIPKFYIFAGSRIERDQIRNVIGAFKDRDSLELSKGHHKKLEIFKIYKLSLAENDCYSICTGGDCSIWLGGKGGVYKVRSDFSEILHQVPFRMLSWSCDYITCVHSGDAIVSYGKTNYVDRFSNDDGKMIEFGHKSLRFTYDIAVSSHDEVAVAVSNIMSMSILLFSKDGKQLKEINTSRGMESFCFDKDGNFIISNRGSFRLTTLDRSGNFLENIQITKPYLRRMRCDGHGNIVGICGNGKEVYMIEKDRNVAPPFTIECDDCINDICIDRENRLLILVDYKSDRR